MVDFVVTIKVQLESLGLKTSKSPGGGGTSASGGGGGGGVPSNINDLRKAFSDLSADVRSVATSLRQLQQAIAAVPPGGAGGSRVSGAGVGGEVSNKKGAEAVREAVKAVQEFEQATKKTAEAVREATSAEEKRADSAEEAAKAVRDSASTQKEAASTVDEVFKRIAAGAAIAEKATDRTTAAEARRASTLATLRSRTKDFDAGKKSPVVQFQKALSGPSATRAVREAGLSLRTAAKDLFSISKDATPAAKKAALEVKTLVTGLINNAIKDVDKGLVDPEFVSKFVSSIRRKVSSREQSGVLPRGTVQFDAGEVGRRLAARNIDLRNREVETALKEFGDAIRKGADAIEVERLAKAFDEAVAVLGDAASAELQRSDRPSAFERRGKRGEDIGAGEATGRIGEFFPPRPKALRLQGQAKEAFNSFNKSIRDLEDPAVATRKVFAILAKDTDKFEDNLRLLSRALKNFTRSSVDSEDEFVRGAEARQLIGGVKRGAGGAFIAPKVTDPKSSEILAQVRIREAQRDVFKTGGQQKIPITLTDSIGNVKKLEFTLKQLGTRLNTVKIQGRDVSDNMFDRTSVRSALARVATWGAAAGIVFGAVNAFRGAVRIVTTTESSVVALAKVMNESEKDFESFKETARDTAVAISKEFGQPLEDVLQTMILFGQQGLKFGNVEDLTRAAALAANVTTLDQPTAASALTAATQQFGVDASKATDIIDKFNEVSNNAAVTETVLAEALKKAGLAANNAGVSLDQFNGIVAAISEQTRQSGQEIGTALRFIFARLTTEEAERGLSGIGVAVRTASGDFRSFIDIVTDISEKFDGLSQAQRTQAAITVAGTRRFNTFLALINNFDRFQEATTNSINSSGSALREQSKVVETAGFRFQQLKTTIAETALSFGDAFLGPLKLAVEGIKGFLGVINAVPSSIKAVAAGVALGTVAFIKFSDKIVDFLGLAGATSGAFGSIRRAVSKSLFEGVSADLQRSQNPVSLLLAQAAGGGTIVAKEVADIAKTASANTNLFAQALKSSSLELLDQRGQVVKNAASFTKFGAVVRNFRVREVGALGDAATGTALGFAALNSGFSKFSGLIVIAANQLIKLSGIGPLAFRLLDRAAAASQLTIATTGVTILRLASAVGVIYLLVKGFQFLRDAITESGETIKKELTPEIARREEAIALINKNVAALERLDRVRSTLASREDKPREIVEESIRRGEFKSPLLSQRRLEQSQRDASENIGLANPQLIDRVDEFGNVILKSADAFDQLATSAASAQENILALTRLRVIEGFAKDLQPAGGLKKFGGQFLRALPLVGSLNAFEDVGKTAGDKFNEELKKFNEALADPRVRAAHQIGIDLGLLDSTLSDKLGKVGADFAQASADIKLTVKAIKDEINALPPDAGELVFQRLLSKGSATREFLNRESQLRTQQSGKFSSPGEVVNQLFLQNRGSLKKTAPLIGVSAEETIAGFNEKGILEQAIDTRKDVAEELKRFAGGELILFENVTGLPEQAIVEITETGRRQIKFFSDELNRFTTQDLAQALNRAGKNVKFFDPAPLKDQLDQALLEITRTVSGAGRGGLLSKDIDLGAAFSFDVSAQQRAAGRDEGLFSDLLRAQREQQAAVQEISSPAQLKEEAASATISAERVRQIRELNTEFDRLAVIVRFRVAIEEVGRSFEKAIEDIERSNIGDRVAREFSGIIGAGRGATPRRFGTTVAPGKLTGEQRFDQLAGDVVLLGNALSEGEKAAGEFVKGLLIATRDRETILRDFQASSQAGGIRDPNRLTALAGIVADRVSGGLNKAQALQVTLAEQSLSAEERSARLLQQLVDRADENPKLLGAALAEASELSNNNPTGRAQVEQRLNSLSSSSLSEFTSGDLERIIQNIPRNLVPAISGELDKRRADTAISDVNTALRGFVDAQRQDREPGFIRGFKESFTKFRETSLGSRAQTDTAQRAALLEAVSRVPAIRGLATGAAAQEIVIPKEVITDFGKATADAFRETPFDALKESAGEIEAGIKSGNKDLLQILETTIRSVLAVRSSAQELKGPKSRLDEQVQKRARDADTKILIDTSKAVNDLFGPLRNAVAAVDLFGRAATTAAKDISDAINKTLADFRIGRELSRFTGPQFGALRGVRGSGVDLGKSRNQLTGSELTALESPELNQGLEEANTAFNGLVEQLKRIKQEQLEIERVRKAFQAEGNIEAIKLADESLAQLASVSLFLEGSATSAQQTLREFGESFKEIEAVNDLRVNVDRLIESFKKQQALLFDQTSVQTALGKTPFSAARPTFEQSAAGQRGDLTAFERAIEDINLRQRSGALSPQDAAGETRKAEFSRDEEIIAFAQQRQNEQLNAQVQTAQQVQGALFDFIQKGGPQAGAAQGLFDLLRDELEGAGDLLTGDFGPQSIRDPRTGRDVNIPASQVRQFQGVPSLERISSEVAKLAAQAREQESKNNAELITQPLLEVLNQVPGKLDSIVAAVIGRAGFGGDIERNNAVRAVESRLASVVEVFKTGGATSTEDVTALVNFSDVLTRLNPEALAKVLQQFPIVSGGQTQPLGQALRGIDTDSAGSEAINRIFERASESGTAFEGLPAQQFDRLGDTTVKLAESMGGLSNVISDTLIQAIGVAASKLSSLGLGGKASPEPFASGGLISGPGGPRADRVPILASAGEFVLNAKAASRIGIPNLHALNSLGLGGRRARSGFGRFQEGGEVGGFDAFDEFGRPVRVAPGKGARISSTARERKLAQESQLQRRLSKRGQRFVYLDTRDGSVKKTTLSNISTLEQLPFVQGFADLRDVQFESNKGKKGKLPFPLPIDDDISKKAIGTAFAGAEAAREARKKTSREKESGTVETSSDLKQKLEKDKKEREDLVAAITEESVGQVKNKSLANSSGFVNSSEKLFASLDLLLRSDQSEFFNDPEVILDSVRGSRFKLNLLRNKASGQSFIPNIAVTSAGKEAFTKSVRADFALFHGGLGGELAGEEVSRFIEKGTPVSPLSPELNQGFLFLLNDIFSKRAELIKNTQIDAQIDDLERLAKSGRAATTPGFSGALAATRGPGAAALGENTAGAILSPFIGLGGTAAGTVKGVGDLLGGTVIDKVNNLSAEEFERLASQDTGVLGTVGELASLPFELVGDTVKAGIDSGSDIITGGASYFSGLATGDIKQAAKGGLKLGKGVFEAGLLVTPIGKGGSAVTQLAKTTSGVLKFSGKVAERLLPARPVGLFERGLGRAGEFLGIRRAEGLRIRGQKITAGAEVSSQAKKAEKVTRAQRAVEEANRRQAARAAERSAISSAAKAASTSTPLDTISGVSKATGISTTELRRRISQIRKLPASERASLRELGRRRAGGRIPGGKDPFSSPILEAPDFNKLTAIEKGALIEATAGRTAGRGAATELASVSPAVTEAVEALLATGEKGGFLRRGFRAALLGGAGAAGDALLGLPGLGSIFGVSAGGPLGLSGLIGGAAGPKSLFNFLGKNKTLGRFFTGLGRGFKDPALLGRRFPRLSGAGSTRGAFAGVASDEAIAAGNNLAAGIARPTLRFDTAKAALERFSSLSAAEQEIIAQRLGIGGPAITGLPTRFRGAVSPFLEQFADARRARALASELNRGVPELSTRAGGSPLSRAKLTGRDPRSRRFRRGGRFSSASTEARIQGFSSPRAGGELAKSELTIREFQEAINKELGIPKSVPSLNSLSVPGASGSFSRKEVLGLADDFVAGQKRIAADAAEEIQKNLIGRGEVIKRKNILAAQEKVAKAQARSVAGEIPQFGGQRVLTPDSSGRFAKEFAAVADSPFTTLPGLGQGRLPASIGRKTAPFQAKPFPRLDLPPNAGGQFPSLSRTADTVPGSVKALEEFLKKKKFAAGGKISGPGGPHSDRVPILASSGEFVLNASAVSRIGLPLVDLMNRTGNIPRFQDGGLVEKTSGGAINLNVNTAEIASAISQAVVEAVREQSLSVDAGNAVDAISVGIQTAFNNLVLPEVEVKTQGVSIPISVPDGGIPLDLTGLQGALGGLGGALGADVRNRLEAVEGTVAGVREDANVLLDVLEGFDPSSLVDLVAQVDSLRLDIEPLTNNLLILSTQVLDQKQEILAETFNLINKEINNLQLGSDISARLEKHVAENNFQITRLQGSVSEAISTANRAMTQALGRN